MDFESPLLWHLVAVSCTGNDFLTGVLGRPESPRGQLIDRAPGSARLSVMPMMAVSRANDDF